MNSKDNVLISTAYLGPIQYFSKVCRYKNIFLEKHENYQKQSFRNRCYILSANGPLALTIPTIHTAVKIPITDVLIDNSTRWKNIHIRAIESAYRSSPFYIYYIDDLIAIYNKSHKYLWDLNNDFLQLILKLLNIEKSISFTTHFKNVPEPFDDFSQCIHPKTKFHQDDKEFNVKPYFQVFENKFGFTTNLSIIDLLFNTGPESIQWL